MNCGPDRLEGGEGTPGMGAKPAVERRRKERISIPFPVKVRGVDAEGEAFEVDAVLDNLGSSGLYMKLGRKVRQGTELFTIIRFSHPQVESETGPRVATRGTVLRVAPLPDGRYGVAVEFTRHRFL